MSNLKTLRSRIKSVKSTQKITKAMNMVAAAKQKKLKKNLSFTAEQSRCSAAL